MEEGQLVSVESLRSLLLHDDDDSLPPDEIVYAFAYGSGVLSQQQQQQQVKTASLQEKRMIDFIIVVRDSYRFHQENLAKNPEHYARPFVAEARDQARRIEWWQRHTVENRFFRNPGLYFNVTETFKYGVVQVEDLLRDLQHWRYLYLAGRMHKPIVTLLDRQAEDAIRSDDTTMSIQNSQDHCNLPAAVSASLLLLSLQQENSTDNEESSLDDTVLFTQIAALSFTGDPRMTAGAEDPAKVSKLVESPGQLQRFRRLYAQALDDLETKDLLSITTTTTTPSNSNGNNETIGTRKISWDMSNPKAHSILWDKLPPSLRRLHQSGDDPLASARALQTTLPTIVAPAARYQSIKGLATAGFQKSWSYALRKLSKGILRK